MLIAISILVSAIHALRPIFPGREAAIAAFFGLIHGLAFAATLSELGLGRWERVAGILAFNLGIETMQMIVVAVTMPSLLLMSRTRAYPVLRISGALFAGLVSWAGSPNGSWACTTQSTLWLEPSRVTPFGSPQRSFSSASLVGAYTTRSFGKLHPQRDLPGTAQSQSKSKPLNPLDAPPQSFPFHSNLRYPFYVAIPPLVPSLAGLHV